MNKTIKLGLMPPLTGVVGIYGTEISRAGQIACAEVNEAGGVLGKPLELIIADDGSMPDSAVAAASRLLDQEGCCALIGNLLSNSRIAVAYQVAEPRHIPYLNFSFYEGSILSRYFFHFAALPNQQIDKMIPFMCHRFGKRMFFAGHNYEWPRGSIDAAKHALLKSGGEIVGEEYLPFNASVEAIEQLLDHVAGEAPDVFVPYFAGEDQIRLLSRFTERGLKSRMAVVMGHYDEIMASHLPPAVRSGFYSSNSYFMSVDTPQNRVYLARLAALPNVSGIWPDGDGILTNFGEGAYLCVKAFALAAEKAGSVEAEALVDALSNIQLAGPQGNVLMDPVTHHAAVNNYLTCCQEDGSFAIIECFHDVEPVIPERYRHLRLNLPDAHEAERERNHEILAMFSLAVEQSYNSIVITNDRAEIEFVNAAFTRVTGYSPADVLGKNPRLLNAGQTPRDTYRLMWQALTQGHTWHGEVINRRKDGRIIIMNQSISPIRQNGSGITHYVAISDDITEAKHNADELHRYRLQLEEMVANRITELSIQTARTKAILRTMLDGVVHIDAQGRILSVNEAMTTLFGYEADELLGANVSLLMPEPDRSAHDGYLARYGETQISTSVCGRRREVNGLHKDGSLLSLELAVNELVDDRGTTFIGVLSDIRERKAIETAHENTRREAERLSQLKSDFLANMSHELRTPLSAVIGLARICARENAGRKAHDTCTRIFNAGQHLLTVVNDILDFSKIAAGKLSIDVRPMRLSAVIDESIELIADQASTKGLELVRPPSHLPDCVLGDTFRIRQILVNLLSNAIKFTPQGKIELMVSQQDEQIIFTVRDDGIGMSEEQLTRIFNPFEQADSSTTRKFGGTGLGLSISMTLAQLMGGSIQAESTPGKGSLFTLRLPLPETTAPVSLPCLSQEESPSAEYPLTGLRILAAEDVEVNRIILEDILDGAGAHCVLVENGRLAVEQVAAHPADFDLVLMDIQMPEMDGHEATQRIRTINPDLPIVGLTAHAMMEERIRCLVSGMVDHITKPIDPPALITAILRWTQRKEATDNTHESQYPDSPTTSFPVVIDQAALNTRFRGKTAFIRKLAQSVLDSQSNTPAKLRHLAAMNDFAELAFLAHSLKGLAGNLSAESMQDLAAQLEKSAKDQEATIRPLADKLAAMLALMLDELRLLIQSEA